MKAIDVGKMTISPFQFESILEVRIEKELNEHATMYVRGTVKDEVANPSGNLGDDIIPVITMEEQTPICLENDGTPYFSGVLQKVKVTCENEGYTLEVYAVSNTILLDKERLFRSFQDNSQTYESILDEILSPTGLEAEFHADETEVENIILQYNETDWAFAKRLASHTQDVLIPTITGEPSFHFGIASGGQEGWAHTGTYSVSRDFGLYRDMEFEEEPLDAKQVTIYTVELDELVCDLGDKFKLHSESLFVCKISLSLVDYALSVVYTLAHEEAIATPKFYNTAITGLVLHGTVLEVENDDVKLHLDIDKDDEDKDGATKPHFDPGTAHFFVYATPYSADGHTGWYIMPEEDDRVQLLFPKPDEKYAYAVSSVRSKDEPSKTDDPDIKFWRTPFGKEIKMDEKEVLITAKDGETFIKINEDDGIVIHTIHPILIQSGSTLNIESKDDMTILTEKNLHIQANESIKIVNDENVMAFVPTDGIQAVANRIFGFTSTNSSGKASIVGEEGKMTISSRKDMALVSTNGNLREQASSNVEISNGSSSIALKSGTVHVKARNIREN